MYRLGFMLAIWLASLPALACPGSDCIRVGSWNVEWFGSSKRDQPVDLDTIEQMARLIAQDWSIDIITLQEINTEQSGNHRGETFSRQPWLNLQKALARQGYHTAAGSSGLAQHIVIAWREPVQLIRQPQDLPGPDHFQINEYCRSANLRRPLGGLFRAKGFDFWLIGLHLKASTGPAACTSAVRSQQVDALLQNLAPLARQDADILLVGDFNASSQHESLSGLELAGFMALTRPELRTLDSGRYSHPRVGGKEPGRGSLLDHIMIRPEPTREWREHSTTIHAPADPQAFTRRFSDHVPIWADFSIHADDD